MLLFLHPRSALCGPPLLCGYEFLHFFAALRATFVLFAVSCNSITFTKISITLRYFFHIGYNGFSYRGFQKLPEIKNVQVIIEEQLSQALKTELTIVGCGRTDAQVHASQFFFHVDIEKSWDYDLVFRLNKNLPDNIAIYDIIPVESQHHARFDATERTYNYFIHTTKDPFLSNISSLYLEKNLKVDEIKKAVLLLLKYQDFRAFCKSAADKSTICKLTSATFFVDDAGDHFRFQVSANRFLRGMIRIIVYQLLRVGRGESTVDEFEHHLISRQPPKNPGTAYPQGLYLSHVKYPFLEIPTKSTLFNSLVREGRWRQV